MLGLPMPMLLANHVTPPSSLRYTPALFVATYMRPGEAGPTARARSTTPAGPTGCHTPAAASPARASVVPITPHRKRLAGRRCRRPAIAWCSVRIRFIRSGAAGRAQPDCFASGSVVRALRPARPAPGKFRRRVLGRSLCLRAGDKLRHYARLDQGNDQAACGPGHGEQPVAVVLLDVETALREVDPPPEEVEGPPYLAQQRPGTRGAEDDLLGLANRPRDEARQLVPRVDVAECQRRRV